MILANTQRQLIGCFEALHGLMSDNYAPLPALTESLCFLQRHRAGIRLIESLLFPVKRILASTNMRSKSAEKRESQAKNLTVAKASKRNPSPKKVGEKEWNEIILFLKKNDFQFFAKSKSLQEIRLQLKKKYKLHIPPDEFKAVRDRHCAWWGRQRAPIQEESEHLSEMQFELLGQSVLALQHVIHEQATTMHEVWMIVHSLGRPCTITQLRGLVKHKRVWEAKGIK